MIRFMCSPSSEKSALKPYRKCQKHRQSQQHLDSEGNRKCVNRRTMPTATQARGFEQYSCPWILEPLQKPGAFTHHIDCQCDFDSIDKIYIRSISNIEISPMTSYPQSLMATPLEG